jgi:hypothetical protein
MIMTSGAEIDSLRQADMTPQRDFGQIVDPHFFADPDVVAGGETPGEFDLYARLDHHTLAELCPEESQQGRLEPAKGEEASFEQQGTDDVPQHADYRSAPLIGGSAVAC